MLSSGRNLLLVHNDGKRWITNGAEDKYHPKDQEIPFGWKYGRCKCVFNDSKNQKEFNLKANRNSEKQKTAAKLMGSKNIRPLTLSGVEYSSRKEAMEKLNITKCKLYMMIYDDNNRKN